MAARKTNRKPSASNRQSSNDRGKLIKIGALWIGEGKNGKFMSGRIELGDENEMRILVFKNGYKEEAKHPDYVIYEPGEPERGYRKNNDEITDDDVPL